MGAKLTRGEGQLELKLFSGPDFDANRQAVKAISGRRWDPDKKVWALPDDAHIAERLMVTVKPEVSADVLSWIKSSKAERSQEILTPIGDDAEVFVPWRDTLYPYQRAAVNLIADRGRAILADDMGLGKTLQSLSAVTEYQIRNGGDGPKLIICPNSVKGTWAREIRQWLGPDTPHYIIEGTPKKRREALEAAVAEDAWVIVNWEQIRIHNRFKRVRARRPEILREPLFGETEWYAAVGDEAHRAKNRYSLQTLGLLQIESNLKLLLTGTPLQNSPDELFPLLKWLYPDQYTSYHRFEDDFVEWYQGQFGKIITGVKNPDKLRFELSTRLIRRTKDGVLDLPEKTRSVVPVRLNPKQAKLYADAENQMWLEVEQAIKAGDEDAKRFAETAVENPSALFDLPNGAAKTVRLRQVASTPALLGGEDDSVKLDTAVEIILDAQPRQFVVFSEFVGTCKALVERLRAKGLRADYLTGEVKPEDRTVLENDFQAGEIDVLVGTIAAMGEGLTLHAADTAIFIERHWVPARNEQAEDRLHRVGQRRPVTILIIEAEDTIDTKKVAPTNRLKQMIVESVIYKDEVKEKTYAR